MNRLFESIFSRFQFRFRDRAAAALILGEFLRNSLRHERRDNIAILGIPRGGIITADIVAKKLSTPYFDIVVPRKLTYPGNEERAIGAVMEDGYMNINPEFANGMKITYDYLEKEKLRQLEEIKRRIAVYVKRRNRDICATVKNRSVVIVDDGAATGATITAAVKWIKRLQCTPKRLIVAIPVAPKNTVLQLEKECEAEVKVLICPSSSLFYSVEQYHRIFDQTTDEEVVKVMKERGF